MKALQRHINQGERPSRLEIGRLHAGEIRGAEAERLRQRIQQDPLAQAWWQELDTSRSQMPPLDTEVVRSLAHRLQQDEPRPRHDGRRRSVWRWLTGGVVVAAAATLITLTVLPPSGNRVKGGADVDFYVLRDGEVHPGQEGELHLPGDRIQFTYRSNAYSSLVLVSLDGYGQVNLYYPAAGDDPVAVVPGERRVLPGSIQLDDAPDFDVFLAFFGAESVDDVMDEVEQVWEEQGMDGLLDLAREPDIDIIYIDKPPKP